MSVFYSFFREIRDFGSCESVKEWRLRYFIVHKHKSENSDIALHVNLTVTMHNLLFSVHNCVLNELIETFDWLSFRKRVRFVHGKGRNSEQKLVAFHYHFHILTMAIRSNLLRLKNGIQLSFQEYFCDCFGLHYYACIG